MNTSHNRRFGEIGVKVITRISVRRLTVGDSPGCSAVVPPLHQSAFSPWNSVFPLCCSV